MTDKLAAINLKSAQRGHNQSANELIRKRKNHMSEGKTKDKRLEEKEKLDAEIARSLSVVKMKEAHKQIEDFEKLRKQSSIKSISKRILFSYDMIHALTSAIQDIAKQDPASDLNSPLPDKGVVKIYLTNIVRTYDSIRFDLQRNADISKEDFERLFPRVNTEFTTFSLVNPLLQCLSMQMVDIDNYCLRLL
jgi:hypothetical protein